MVTNPLPRRFKTNINRHPRDPLTMGCTCSKVQNEEGISRCRSRKRVVKKALKWRNQYAAAHSEYIIALANLGVAVRQFTDGEFRDHISSSSDTSSSTSTPIPRTPTTPPTDSVVEEIVSRVKLPPMAVKSNPPSSISVIVSPPRTPKGSSRKDEEYQRYMEADAPPDGLYTYIKQPAYRSSSPPAEPSSSYGYSSYSSSDPYSAPASSSQYSTMPSEPPSWDIFGIFHFPPTMEFYNGGIAEEMDDDRHSTKRVVEEEDMPELEVESPDRDRRHRDRDRDRDRRKKLDSPRRVRSPEPERRQKIDSPDRYHREPSPDRRHDRQPSPERGNYRGDSRDRDNHRGESRDRGNHRGESRDRGHHRGESQDRGYHRQPSPDRREPSPDRGYHREPSPDRGYHRQPSPDRGHHRKASIHEIEEEIQEVHEERKHHDEPDRRQHEERYHEEPERRHYVEEREPERRHHEEYREAEVRAEKVHEKSSDYSDHGKKEHEEDRGRKGKNKSVILEELEEEEEPRKDAHAPSSSRAVFNEIVEEEARRAMPEPPRAAAYHHEEKRPPPLVRRDMEVWEVLRIIDDQFQKASRTGDDVSRILEARRAHHNSSFSESGFTKRSARIFKAVSRSSQWSSPRTPLSWNASEDSSSDDFVTTREEGNGGTVLDRLYAWEKKLYTEVKENDIINVDYERKCKRLKKLDARGASNELIDKTTVSVKVLETQMQVSMHAMKATSKAIQDLTDKYMHPQLLDLLDKSMIMWKSMASCHERQKAAVARLKQGGQTPLEATSNSHRQATMQLEHALNQWHRSLESLTTKHREYMRNLTSWLRLSTYTPDRDKDKKVERPPPVLHLCHTWMSALEGLPNGEAVQAIKNFAEAIRNIARLQAEEGKIQKRAEVSAKELSKKAQALHNLEKKLFSASSMSTTTMSSSSGTKSKSSSPSRERDEFDGAPIQDTLMEKKVALELFKKRVEEEKDNFSRAMQETRKMTLECLESGLPPLFNSFSDYAECCSRAYHELQQRVRNVDGVSS